MRSRLLDYTSLDESDLDLVRAAGRLSGAAGETRGIGGVKANTMLGLSALWQLEEQFLAPGGEYLVLSRRNHIAVVCSHQRLKVAVAKVVQ